MAFKALSGVFAGTLAFLAAGEAMAQSRDNYFARDRNVSVTERDRPGYQALGLPLGAFLLFPKIEVGVQGNDNIYSQGSHGASDLIGIASPQIDLASQWSRNSLTAFVRSSTRQYASHTSENATDWQFGGTGQVDGGDTTFKAGGDYGFFAQPRWANIGENSLAQFTTVRPVGDYQSAMNADVIHTINRIQLEGQITYNANSYLNGENANGQVVHENQYDYDRTYLIGKVSYAVMPEASIYGAFSYNMLNYPNGDVLPGYSPNPNSTGETYDIGANFDLTHLIRGDVELGYLQQVFAGDKLSTITGFQAKGDVQYFPTQLITLTLTGSRNVDASTIAGSPGTITGQLSGQADYELLRNLILSAEAQWSGSSYEGLDRHDNVTELTASGQYLMNRNIGLHLAYDFLRQDSTGTQHGVNFTENRVTLTTVLQY
ncbi:MAG TPA: outer membrane beta-barrel protein [Caulobacteraceae bacterium]|nr:outer membrane beta-barrel protein [Caulobacteraceae bacterium]